MARDARASMQLFACAPSSPSHICIRLFWRTRNAGVSNQGYNHEAALIELTRDKTLADYTNMKRIGKSTTRDRYYGVNSVVIKAELGSFSLVLKALVGPGVADREEAQRARFHSELEIGDATKGRMPYSQYVLRAVRTFLDDAHLIPGWAELKAVMEGNLPDRTFVCVMPFFPRNLKSVVSEARRGAHPPIDERIALAWFVHILRGAKHLHDHGIVHRDLKLDNVMMSGEEDPLERTVVIADLGEALDCVEDGTLDWTEPFTRGTSRGGAPMTIPPEVMAVVPGRHAVADYRAADAWALGRLLNDMLREREPYTTMMHSEMRDATFVPMDGFSAKVRELHAGLLRVEPDERLTIDAGLARAEEALAAISSYSYRTAPKIECITCFDDFEAAKGLWCAAQAHFVCDECVGRLLLASAQDGLPALLKRDGRCFCPERDECGSAFYSDGDLATHMAAIGTPGTFELYIGARMRLKEHKVSAGAEERAEAKVRSELERKRRMSEREQAVYDARNEVTELLTLRCPRCKMAFYDFSGCFAIKCGSCPCTFCAWCLDDCGDALGASGKNPTGCHLHVSRCTSRPKNAPGKYFAPKALFDAQTKRRRERDLRAYFKSLDHAICEEVMINSIDLLSPPEIDLGAFLQKLLQERESGWASSGLTALERLTALYALYDPLKDVSALLAKYAGREQILFQAVAEKYGAAALAATDRAARAARESGGGGADGRAAQLAVERKAAAAAAAAAAAERATAERRRAAAASKAAAAKAERQRAERQRAERDERVRAAAAEAAAKRLRAAAKAKAKAAAARKAAAERREEDRNAPAAIAIIGDEVPAAIAGRYSRHQSRVYLRDKVRGLARFNCRVPHASFY
jgi:serine/threonine protein kinase